MGVWGRGRRCFLAWRVGQLVVFFGSEVFFGEVIEFCRSLVFQKFCFYGGGRGYQFYRSSQFLQFRQAVFMYFMLERRKEGLESLRDVLEVLLLFYIYRFYQQFSRVWGGVLEFVLKISKVRKGIVFIIKFKSVGVVLRILEEYVGSFVFFIRQFCFFFCIWFYWVQRFSEVKRLFFDFRVFVVQYRVSVLKLIGFQFDF